MRESLSFNALSSHIISPSFAKFRRDASFYTREDEEEEEDENISIAREYQRGLINPICRYEGNGLEQKNSQRLNKKLTQLSRVYMAAIKTNYD